MGAADEQRSSRRRDRKRIVVREDGAMFDLSARRPISTTALREYLQDGGLFEAATQQGGRDCTYEVLRKIVGAPDPSRPPPGAPGPMSALGVLGKLLPTDPSAFGGLANFAEAFGSSEPEWERPRRRRMQPPTLDFTAGPREPVPDPSDWTVDPRAPEDGGRP